MTNVHKKGLINLKILFCRIFVGINVKKHDYLLFL